MEAVQGASEIDFCLVVLMPESHPIKRIGSGVAFKLHEGPLFFGSGDEIGLSGKSNFVSKFSC